MAVYHSNSDFSAGQEDEKQFYVDKENEGSGDWKKKRKREYTDNAKPAPSPSKRRRIKDSEEIEIHDSDTDGCVVNATENQQPKPRSALDSSDESLNEFTSYAQILEIMGNSDECNSFSKTC